VLCASLWPDPADEHCPQAFRDAAAKILCQFAEHVRTDKQVMELCAAHWTRWRSTDSSRLRAKDPACWWDMRHALLDFIADFANWDASSVRAFNDTASALTLAAHRAMGTAAGRPLVADPFAGGGSFPLESLRVGADAFASDLNPVPVLLNRILLEYIPRLGSRLGPAVRDWGAWIQARASERLLRYYGTEDEQPIAYLWARTVRCEGPACGAEIPLFRSPLICQRANKPVGVRLTHSKVDTLEVSLVTGRDALALRGGTSKGGAATCPRCGHTTSVERVRSQLSARRGGAADARLLAIVTDTASGRGYRAPKPADLRRVADAERLVKELGEKADGFGVPDEPLNHLRGFFNVVLYGMERWGELFTPRQLASLLTFWRILRDELPSELRKHYSASDSVAIVSAMACVLGRATNGWSSVCRWHSRGEKIEGTFARQALPMVWDFAEANPFSKSTGNFLGAVEWVADVCDEVARGIGDRTLEGRAAYASATAHPLPDDAVDLIATDPPYYDAVPYADLSDYFYVWLRRGLADTLPDLFSTATTPKADECVMLAHRAAMYRNKDAAFFEAQMSKAVAEARRVTKPGGCGVFVFANKSTSGWEAMLNALVSSGWVVTASWPIDTEMAERLRARGSAALASSVHLVCRPREPSQTEEVGTWRSVLAELPKRIHEWMPRLAEEGVVGADAIFACLGPALEIYSRYSRVEKASGEPVALKEYLEQVWAAVSKEALSLMFEGADASGLEEDARLTAMWLWTLGAGGSGPAAGAGQVEPSDEDADDEDDEGAAGKALAGFVLDFDTARKIAQGLGAHLDKLAGVVEVKGSKARLLSVAERTKVLLPPHANLWAFQVGSGSSPSRWNRAISACS
jgi:adenine-specific DNA methylase